MPDYPGFVCLAKPGESFRMIVLKAGQTVADLRVEMTPRGIMSGRVLNPAGDPVANVAVHAMPAKGPTPLGFQAFLTRGLTDDRGEFRIGAPPGKYYLKAELGQNQPPEVRTDGSEQPVYRMTYFPASPSKAGASEIDVVPGKETAGLEIRLTRSRVFSVSGFIHGIPDGNRPASIKIVHRGSDGESISPQWALTDASGRFSVSKVPAGRVRLVAYWAKDKIVMLSRDVDLSLDSADVSNIELALSLGEPLIGTLEFSGEPRDRPIAENLTVRLWADDGFEGAGPYSGSVAKDGTFRIDAVHARKLTAHVTQLPENAFLERIFLDDVPTDEEVDLTRGVKGSHLRIVINRRGGHLSGKIVDTEGQAVQTPAVVHLMAEGKVKYVTGVSGGNKFVIQGIRPGKYRLIAIDRLDQFQFQGIEGLKALAAEAPEIEIREGDLLVRDLTLMRKGAANANQ